MEGAMRRLIVAFLAVAALLGAAPRPARPNIVVIMFDDLSPRIGAYGDKLARTPNLDAFAKEAVRYTNAFTTSPVCAPSRAALFSGMHQNAIGAQHMRTKGIAGLKGGGPIEYEAVPPPRVKWFPELLRRAGYYTINVGKTDYQIGDPFTIWDVDAPQADWRQRPKDKPFLAFINLHHTHESYLWPEDRKSDNPLVNLVTERNRREFADKPRFTDPAKVVVPPYLPDTPAVRADLARLYDNIAFDEANVGRIMAALREDGVLDDTIVIIASDHGDGLPRMKRAIHDAGLRVPLMIRFPDGMGAAEPRLVSFVDLAPTILSLAGVEAPAHMHGRPFAGPKKAAPRDYAFAAADRFDQMPERARTVIDGRFQYVRNFMPEVAHLRPLPFRDALPTMQEMWRLSKAGQLSPTMAQYFAAPRATEELYDLQADPHTVRNVASDPAYRSHILRLRRAFDGWQRRVPDLGALPEREMIARMWSGLEQPTTAAPQGKIARKGATAVISLASATPGASVGFSMDGPDAKSWQLYTTPVSVPAGRPLWAKAIRYGYAESPVARIATSPE
jgi:N-sulfoglucosamine sulfohydrolase